MTCAHLREFLQNRSKRYLVGTALTKSAPATTVIQIELYRYLSIPRTRDAHQDIVLMHCNCSCSTFVRGAVQASRVRVIYAVHDHWCTNPSWRSGFRVIAASSGILRLIKSVAARNKHPNPVILLPACFKYFYQWELLKSSNNKTWSTDVDEQLAMAIRVRAGIQ